MRDARFTLRRLGAAVQGWGIHAEDLCFGGSFVLADEVLAKQRKIDPQIIATHVLVVGEISMTPCTSWLAFEPELARLLAEGLARESSVPLSARLESREARAELAADVIEMACCTVESVRAALLERFADRA